MKKLIALAIAGLLATSASYANVCNPSDPDFSQSACDGLITFNNITGRTSDPNFNGPFVVSLASVVAGGYNANAVLPFVTNGFIEFNIQNGQASLGNILNTPNGVAGASVPLDGGASLLIAAGVGVAVKARRKKKAALVA